MFVRKKNDFFFMAILVLSFFSSFVTAMSLIDFLDVSDVHNLFIIQDGMADELHLCTVSIKKHELKLRG